MTFDEWWESNEAAHLEWKHEARAGWDAALHYGNSKNVTQHANTAICPYYKVSDLAHAGDRAGLVECTCYGRPDKQQ